MINSCLLTLGWQAVEYQLSGVNFINVLRAAFAPVDPESIKDTHDLTVFFTLWVSTSVKAVHRTLMKLSPGIVGLGPSNPVKK